MTLCNGGATAQGAKPCNGTGISPSHVVRIRHIARFRRAHGEALSTQKPAKADDLPGSPGLARPVLLGFVMNKSNELKDRIEAKKHELLARLAELKADTRAEAGEQREKISAKLDQLEQNLKDGWENLSDKVSGKLNEWLKN
jgi:DNA-binding transcriptional MerR regulator